MGGSDLAPSIEKVPLIMIACPKIEICVRKPYTNWAKPTVKTSTTVKECGPLRRRKKQTLQKMDSFFFFFSVMGHAMLPWQ
jgi:hypothetical protein